MKKVVFTFILLAFEVFSANLIFSGGASIIRRVNMEISQSGTVLISQTGGADTSYDAGIEGFIPLADFFSVGAGVRFEPQITTNGSSDSGIGDIIPIYLITKVLLPIGNFALTTQINGGYDLVLPKDNPLVSNLTGGLYYGIGVGIEMEHFVVGANYNFSTLEGDFVLIPGYKLSAKASKLNVTVGYKIGE